MKRLLEIQQKLNAPKNQRNNFGWYNYRSCEDIIQAVKPLLAEQKLVLNLTDEIVLIGDRFYVKATAIVVDLEWKPLSASTGYAREEETKKWMDWSQITGASSSYARKYALNWLFAIDDWVDSDKTNKGEWWEVKKEVKKPEGSVSQKAEKSDTPDTDEKPWFNKPELDRLKENKEWYLQKFESSDALITDIQKYYIVSAKMKVDIADVWAAVE